MWAPPWEKMWRRMRGFGFGRLGEGDGVDDEVAAMVRTAGARRERWVGLRR